MAAGTGTTKPGGGRRRKAKPKIENYYKILGIRSNATPESVKKSYIAMVKQYPPEQYPEQFQMIRRAYEALRDPAKRAEYDFQRKYGGSVASMMDEAFELLENEEWDKAEKLLRKALDIAPTTVAARLGLLQLHLIRGDEAVYDKEAEELLAVAEEAGDSQMALYTLARHLYSYDRPAKALNMLERMYARFPESRLHSMPLLTDIYRDLGRTEEAFELAETMLPAPGQEQPDQYELFFNLIHVMIALNRWQYWSKVQPRVKKFLKSIADPDDRRIVIDALLEESREFKQLMMFKEALLFADLAHLLEPGLPEVRKAREEASQLQRLEKELQSLPLDRSLWPIASLQATTWFQEEFGESDIMQLAYGSGLIDEVEETADDPDREYRLAIGRIKSKYPLIYKRYQDKWDTLLEELGGS